MRTIFIVGILLVCAFMAGWFTVHRDDEGTTIKFNRDEIRGDTRQVIDRGREFLDRNRDQVYDNGSGYEDQVAQRPHFDNGQPGYNPQGQQYGQQPSTDPQYQQYQNPQYQQQQFQQQYQQPAYQGQF